jgi:hypothetical protein
MLDIVVMAHLSVGHPATTGGNAKNETEIIQMLSIFPSSGWPAFAGHDNFASKS